MHISFTVDLESTCNFHIVLFLWEWWPLKYRLRSTLAIPTTKFLKEVQMLTSCTHRKLCRSKSHAEVSLLVSAITIHSVVSSRNIVGNVGNILPTSFLQYFSFLFMHTHVHASKKASIQLNENSLCSLPGHCAGIFWSSHFICKQRNFSERGER